MGTLCSVWTIGLGLDAMCGWDGLLTTDVGQRGISHAAHYGTWTRESYCRGERDANLKGKIRPIAHFAG